MLALLRRARSAGPNVQHATAATAPPDVASSASQPSTKSPACPLLGLTLALLLVGVASKLILLPFPVASLGQFVRWCLRLAIVAHEDVCFVGGLAGGRGILGWAARRFRWTHRSWLAVQTALFCLAGAYFVVSVPMYRVMVVPFSVRVISFIGGAGSLWSSLEPYLSPQAVSSLFLVPAALWGVSRAGQRRLLRLHWAPRDARAWAAAGIVLVLYATACRSYVAQEESWQDPNRWERRIARNVHWYLLSSAVEELAKDRPFTADFQLGHGNESDFQPLPPAVSTYQPPAGQRPKNILLIVLESTGVEYLSPYGSRHPTWPQVERLAQERGVVFENFYAHTTCSPKSLIALTAAVYPRPDWLMICRDDPEFDIPMVAQVLQPHGYRSCFAHSGFWSWNARDKYLRDRGADRLIDATPFMGELMNSWGIDDKKMFDELFAWIDEKPDQPFFALAYTLETHHPYVTPPQTHDFDTQNEELWRYLNAERGADAHIARVIEELKRRGLDESTVVAVTADHGEAFGQHGMRSHSFCIYEQTVHLPFIVLHPSLANAPRRSPTPGQHIDVLPTLLDMVGVQPPAVWQGRSLFATERMPRTYFASFGNEVMLGLRDGQWKYHLHVEEHLEELFDLSADRGENQNLAEQQPELCAAYRQRVAGWVQSQRRFLGQHGVR